MTAWLFRGLIDALDRLTAELRRDSQWRRQPRFRSITLMREVDMALVYSVSAASPTATDVVERRLTVEYPGSEPVTKTYGPNDTTLGEITVPQDAEVTLTLIDVDDVGNTSEPAVATFTAVDTIAPAKPGELGVTLVREE